MIAPHNGSYRNSQNPTLGIFGLRYPGITNRLYRERVAWREQSEIEPFIEGSLALSVRSNSILRLAT